MAQDVIDQIIHKLPGASSNGQAPAIRVLTVRLPADLHTALREEAAARHVSANKLAIAKLSIKAETLDALVETKEKRPRKKRTPR